VRLRGRFDGEIDRLKIPVLLFNLAPHEALFCEFSSTTFGLQTTLITGFNTDVEHEGVVYHVQTEDKGLKSPLILSLVYVGGTILASKRTTYNDLIDAGFDENRLAERLQRQHKLICAAIHAGRIEDLKRQTERDAVSRVKPPKTQAPEVKQPEPEPLQSQPTPPPPENFLVSNADDEPSPISFERTASPPGIVSVVSRPPEKSEQEGDSRVVEYDGAVEPIDELHINLLDEKKFVAGEFVRINVYVGGGDDGRESISEAAVTLKVLGSSFRPLIFSGKTGRDGVVTFYAMLPHFTSGRAAILLSATSKGHKAELRRVIHQA
jgi:hypothetical protein